MASRVCFRILFRIVWGDRYIPMHRLVRRTRVCAALTRAACAFSGAGTKRCCNVCLEMSRLYYRLFDIVEHRVTDNKQRKIDCPFEDEQHNNALSVVRVRNAVCMTHLRKNEYRIPGTYSCAYVEDIPSTTTRELNVDMQKSGERGIENKSKREVLYVWALACLSRRTVQPVEVTAGCILQIIYHAAVSRIICIAT